MHLKKELQYSLNFIMFAFLSLAWEVYIYILNPQWILWKRQKKKKDWHWFVLFMALIKLSLFFFKGEPGKPGEQGLMASIWISLFLCWKEWKDKLLKAVLNTVCNKCINCITYNKKRVRISKSSKTDSDNRITLLYTWS